LTSFYVGAWGEWMVRIVGGLLLLSATNTAITDMISVQYLMARDGEVPRFMQKLNRFGVPWIPAVIAASVPAFILIISHDLESLAALYAIGVIGAVAINVSLCSIHPRLRRLHRKVPMMLLGTILLAIWVTLACTKLHALLFVSIVIAIGLSARALTKWYATRKGPRQSLLHEAILEQITPQALAKPRLLVGTYGSEQLAPAALIAAKNTDSTLVICFIREVALSFKYEGHQTRLTLETDLAAQRTFARYLELAHQADVSILPVYDTGANAPELIAENAAVHACSKVLIGSSRRGMVHQIIKGNFQRQLEALLPPEIHVQVLGSNAEELNHMLIPSVQSRQISMEGP
jgi:hypothetical protein